MNTPEKHEDKPVPFMLQFKEFVEETSTSYYSKSTGCAGREDEDDD